MTNFKLQTITETGKGARKYHKQKKNTEPQVQKNS